MEEAAEVLDDKRDYPVPPEPDPPVSEKAKLRNLRALVYELDTNFDEAQRIMLGLRQSQHNLNDIRLKMTEKERMSDNAAYEEFVDDNDYTAPMKELAGYCKKLRTQKGALLYKIEDLEDIIAVAPNPQIPNRSGAFALPNAVNPTPVEPSVHAPDLPKFDGDLANWATFWSQFKYLIHDSKRLPPALKLKHLIDSCKGSSAQKLVEGFEMKDENYPLALNRLKERFSDTEAVKDALDHKLNILKPTDGTLEDLSRFIDELENIFLRMEALGEPTDARHIRSLIIKKVPSHLMEKLHAAERSTLLNNDQWTTRKMREFLKEHHALKQRTSRSLAEARAESAQSLKLSHEFHPRGSHFQTQEVATNFQYSQGQSSTMTFLCTRAQIRMGMILTLYQNVDRQIRFDSAFFAPHSNITVPFAHYVLSA
ncbi:hypothetical protein DdX_17336 [Ditylenchus destructor]|uniref:Uncharacterized protein n=1 Tax=Ditylenchus destructor TaxID=166010 RepID=A0AAD4MS20_9BILA|nr:hypothetical protein DdX_17336 [Ditylenchus destructor]